MDIGVYRPATGTAVAAVETILTVPAALPAVLTQNNLGELAGAKLLAHAGLAVKNIAVGNASTPQGLLETIQGPVLANYRKNRHAYTVLIIPPAPGGWLAGSARYCLRHRR